MGVTKRGRYSALVRDEQDRKECGHCLNWLPESEYYKCNTLTIDGLQGSCKICQTVHKYGLNRNDLIIMLKEQNGRCPICLTPVRLTDKKYCLDHDHSCCPHKSACKNCIRGLLCWDCNIGIGKFEDDTQRLQRAIQYLRKTR